MSCTSIEAFLDEDLGKEKKDLENLLRRLSNKQTRLKISFKCGGVPGILESLAALLEEGPGASEAYRKISSAVEEYPLATYLEQGFDGPFRNALKEEGIPVRGEFPKYEIFPFVVKIMPKEGVAVINKKKSQGLRVNNLVGIIKKERERFFKMSFRAEEFLADLAGAYDYLLRIGKEKTKSELFSSSLPILDIHRTLTPMKRWRREYTPQLFGFDIYRLLKEEVSNPNATVYRDGDRPKKCSFGSTRIGSPKGITVVEENGRETTFGSVKFEEIGHRGD